MHGEEIGFVTELGDERELVLDQRAHIGRHVIAQRRRPAPALRGAAFDEFTQPLSGRTPLGHDLARIFIAQLIERESATRRDGPSRGEQLRRIEARETLAFAQMPLAGGLQREPGRIDRGAEADRRQRIVQPTPRPQVHAYRAGRHERQVVRRTERRERRQMRPLCAIAQQLGSDPGRTREMRAQPERCSVGREVGCDSARTARRCKIRRARRPEHEAMTGFDDLHDIGARELVAALGRCAPTPGDEAAELPVAAPVGGQQHQRQAACESELRTDDQARASPLERSMGAHHARHRTLVGDGKRVITERIGTLGELLRLRGAAQEAETAEAVQLGVSGGGCRMRGWPRHAVHRGSVRGASS